MNTGFSMIQMGVDLISVNLIFYIVIGVIVGVIGGCLPGISCTMILAILVPMTFGLDPVYAMGLLVAAYSSAIAGGSITAILVNVPGTPSNIATGFDGYPMAQKGLAGKAIGLAITSSFVGGILSVLILIFFSPIIAKAALAFGSQEYAAIALLGLSLIAFVSQGTMLKGLVGGVIGLTLAVVGSDPITGFHRFTFGQPELIEGINNVIVMIGMFGLSEVIIKLGSKEYLRITEQKVTRIFVPFKEILKLLPNMIRASIIGTLVGAAPAAGPATAAIISYSQEKRFSKDSKLFGTGHPPGIVAAEAANNATCGGALIPMLTLGIPGDPMTAILIGALIIHGLRPGPLLFVEQTSFVSSIFVSAFIAQFFMFFAVTGLTRYLVKLLKTPGYILYPMISVFCFLGTYAIQNSVIDVGIMTLAGFFGAMIRTIGIPVSCVVLGLILGPIFEENFRRSMVLTNDNLFCFFTRPVSLVIILITLLITIFPFISDYIKNKQTKELRD